MRRMKDMEPKATDAAIRDAADLALTEVLAAVRANEGFASFHEGYGVLTEEVEELWDEIKVKRATRSRGRIHDEAIQVAAMAIEIAAIASMERDT